MPMRPPVHRPNGSKARTRDDAERERKARLDERRPSSGDRGYDADWRAVRKQFLARHPTCQCGRPATEADHVLAVRDRPDLRLSWSNLRALCRPCHSRRTATDQGFGAARRNGAMQR